MGELHEWVKVVHIVAVISWMAGMLYLPRLFVYHVQAEVGSDKSETFKVMERKLLKVIINPAMIVAWICGLILAYWIVARTDSWADVPVWLYCKLGVVFLLSGFHGNLSRWRKDFEADKNTKSERFYRIVNEVPAVLMVLIVILVIIKPFS